MENDKIELRSPKVRQIIGQIPPLLVRTGISLIFAFIILLIVGSKYFSIPYSIKTEVEIIPKGNYFLLSIYIPAEKYKQIKTGQKLRIKLDSIPNLYNQFIDIKIKNKASKLLIKQKTGLVAVNMQIDSLPTNTGLYLHLSEKQNFAAKIDMGKISFFDKVFGFLFH